jgi:hypothetical protein
MVQGAVPRSRGYVGTRLQLPRALEGSLLVFPLSEAGASGQVPMQEMPGVPVSDRPHGVCGEEDLLKAGVEGPST